MGRHRDTSAAVGSLGIPSLVGVHCDCTQFSTCQSFESRSLFQKIPKCDPIAWMRMGPPGLKCATYFVLPKACLWVCCYLQRKMSVFPKIRFTTAVVILGISCVYKDIISYFFCSSKLLGKGSSSLAWSRQSQLQDFSLQREGTFLLEGWDLQAVGELVRLPCCAGKTTVCRGWAVQLWCLVPAKCLVFIPAFIKLLCGKGLSNVGTGAFNFEFT